jgi:hypothetical protein
MPTQKSRKEFETGLIVVKTNSSQRLGERERSTDDWALESPLKRPPNQTKNHQTPTYCMFSHSVFCFCVGTDQFWIFLN